GGVDEVAIVIVVTNTQLSYLAVTACVGVLMTIHTGFALYTGPRPLSTPSCSSKTDWSLAKVSPAGSGNPLLTLCEPWFAFSVGVLNPVGASVTDSLYTMLMAPNMVMRATAPKYIPKVPKRLILHSSSGAQWAPVPHVATEW